MGGLTEDSITLLKLVNLLEFEISFCLLVVWVNLNITVIIFSVMLGRSQLFLSNNQNHEQQIVLTEENNLQPGFTRVI